MRHRHQWRLSASLMLAVVCLLVTGCGSSGTSSTNGANDASSPTLASLPQLEGTWTGVLTETTQHIEWAKFNLRLTQDSNNQLSGTMRVYDDTWGDKVWCAPLTGTAQPTMKFHLDAQQVVSNDMWFMQFDGASATAGFALSGVYGMGRTTLAQLSGTMARTAEDGASISCPSSNSATPTP